MNIFALIGILGSIVVSVWATLKFIIGQSFRLDDNISKLLIEKIRLEGRFTFELSNEFSFNKKYPAVYTCFSNLNGNLIYFSRDERLLTAGWQGKETLSEIHFLRWQKSAVFEMLSKLNYLNDSVNVMMLQPYGTDKIGEIGTKNVEISLDKFLYEDIEKDIESVLNENNTKTGCLLYGKPGTGKTRLVKYLAQKFNLPIYSIYFSPDFNNFDILSMFASIPERCIVLFEDFDNYFDQRKCIMKNDNVKFTFDAILNGLDGVYNNYKSVIFIMTANEIEKIDDAIKHRSSRFKFVREITTPSFEKRFEILDNEDLAKLTENMSMDKIYFVKDLKDRYNIEQIKEKININI